MIFVAGTEPVPVVGYRDIITNVQLHKLGRGELLLALQLCSMDFHDVVSDASRQGSLQ